MKIKIDAVEMPQSPLHEPGITYCYPSVIGQQTMTTDDMVEHIQNVCTLTRIDCNAAIEAMTAYIARSIADGNLVHIDGLGTFSPGLAFVDSTKKALQQTAGDVRLTDVNFRPEGHLLTLLRSTMMFDRKVAQHSHNIHIGTVVLELQKYFAQHKDMTARQFESMFDLRRTRANTILCTLVKQGKLIRRPIGRAYMYYAGPNLQAPQKG